MWLKKKEGSIFRKKISQFQLFYLITDAYQTSNNSKELRRFAYEIFSTFLIPNAPLQVVDISQPLIQNIDKVLRFPPGSADQLDQLKKLFIPARTRAVGQINHLLDEFKSARARLNVIQQVSLGLGVDLTPFEFINSMSGTSGGRATSTPKHDHSSEIRLAEQILFRTLESLLQVAGVTNVSELADSGSAVASAVEPQTLALIMAVASVIKVGY